MRRSWAASSTRARAWPWSGRSCAVSRGPARESPRRPARAARASGARRGGAREAHPEGLRRHSAPPGDTDALRPSSAPALLLAGSADPLDPPANVSGWRAAFPNGRLVTVPGLAHGVVAYGCLRLLVARFVDEGSARGLDTAVRGSRAAALRAQLSAGARGGRGRAHTALDPERADRAEHRHDRGHEERGAGAVDDALGRRVGACAVEHQHGDGDAEDAAELTERGVRAGGLADVLGERRSECRRRDVREHERDPDADGEQRDDELGVARADAHGERRAAVPAASSSRPATTNGRLPMRPPSDP